MSSFLREFGLTTGLRPIIMSMTSDMLETTELSWLSDSGESCRFTEWERGVIWGFGPGSGRVMPQPAVVLARWTAAGRLFWPVMSSDMTVENWAWK